MDIVEKLYTMRDRDLDDYDDQELVHNAAEEIKKLRKENAELKVKQEWLPLYTAPRDGSSFLIYTGNCEYGYGEVETNPHIACAFYSEKNKCFQSDSWSDVKYRNPTHWQPLPQAPKGEDDV